MAKAGDVIDNPCTGERITFLKTASDTGGSLLQIELVAQPNGFPVGAHTHPKQEEHFHIISGELSVWLDGQAHHYTAGDKLVIPSGTPHYWTNTGHEELKIIIELRPALRWETYFESMFGLARDGKTDKKGMPNPFQMAVIAHEFRDEAGPVTRAHRLIFKLLPLLAVLGRWMGYKASYPEYTRQEVHSPARISY
jgi:quercetin dioxygenase-like cupin family protein